MISTGVAKIEGDVEDGDVDFVKLLKAGPSLKKFYSECVSIYGIMSDSELTDDDFQRMAHFELGLRMHGKNKSLITSRTKLVDVIDLLCDSASASTDEKISLHNGRHFLNYIKHQTSSYTDLSSGLIEFNDAYKVTEKYRWQVV